MVRFSRRAKSIITFTRPTSWLVCAGSGTGPSSGYLGIHAEIGGQLLDADLRDDQRLQPLVFVLGLGVAAPDHGHDAGHYLDGLGWTAVDRSARFHVGIERAPGIEILLHGENDFRGLGGELAAVLGLAGLHDHRMTLRRPVHGERAAYRE